MIKLQRICITNDAFRSTTETRDTRSTCPSAMNSSWHILILFKHGVLFLNNSSRAVLEWSKCYKAGDRMWGRGEHDMIAAWLMGLSTKLRKTDELKSRCLSFSWPSPYSSVARCGITQQESPSYSENAAQSELWVHVCVSVCGFVCDMWGMASGVIVVVEAERSHRWVTRLLLHCLWPLLISHAVPHWRSLFLGSF